MLINPYTGVANSALSGAKAPANRLEKAVEQLSSGNRVSKAADDVSSLAIATKLQNEVTGLRTALTNTALYSSLSQTAGRGATQIQTILSELQNLSTKASSGTLSTSNREALDKQFQALVAEIDRIATNTTFSDKILLDGSISGEASLDISGALGEESTEDSQLSIESLKSADLLGTLDIRSTENAEVALSVIQQALNNVGTTIASIGAFSEQIDYASAFLETGIANQDAARSVLSEADFAEAATELSQANLQQNLQIAVQAQSKRLPPSMLELVQS